MTGISSFAMLSPGVVVFLLFHGSFDSRRDLRRSVLNQHKFPSSSDGILVPGARLEKEEPARTGY